ncbi:MAG: VPLPA-CTERM sorting domain-containing protein, partial [Pseudomonadota bacterium]
EMIDTITAESYQFCSQRTSSHTYRTDSTCIGGVSFEDHLDPDIGADLLPALAAGTLAGSGFDAPLGEGVYTFLVQQTGPQLNGYSLEFVVSAVPVPAALPLLLGALGALGAVARRR